MVDTIKFSQMNAGGDLAPGEMTPGLLSGANVLFNNPWTFLAPGSTAARPVPSPAIDGRLRFNTDTLVYEYYDTISSTWVELSGSGTGTVNPGMTNAIAYYASGGTIVSGLNTIDNALLVTDASGVPSFQTTLPVGLTIPGAIITSSTAALTSGQVAATPVNATDIANKSYVDASFAAGVNSITGTANQIIASSATGNVTLSLPQDIAPGSTPSFVGLTLSSIPLGASSGGTGVNNGSYTLTLGGSMVTDGAILFNGAFGVQFNFTASTNVTFPTTGTLATTSQLPTGAALTEVNDTNVTLTLGGSPTVALLAATSITAGWTGQLSIGRGGTGVSSVTTAPTASAWAGWDANKNLSANNFLPGTALITNAGATTTLTVGSAGQQIFSGSTFQTVQLPVVATLATGTPYRLINDSSNSLFVISSGSNAVVTMQPLTQALLTFNGTAGTAAASWDVQYTSNTIGVQSIIGTANQVIASSSTGNITLSLPQSIASTSSPTFAGMTLTNPYIAGAGGLHSFQIFTSGTAATYTKPANVSSILVEVVGGGGGGGGVPGAASSFAAGGGGGSGGYARLFIPNASSTFTFTVGAGGAGGTAGSSNGSPGGTTTFSASSLQATGGGGGSTSGEAIATAAVFSAGGSAGVGTNGDFNAAGAPGAYGLSALANLSSGNGGSSIYGGGGAGITNAVGAGNAAGSYGSGGSGGAATTSAAAGGNGSGGIIIVWEFS